MDTITVNETQDRKSVNREIRRISNTSFLPVLIFLVLDISYILFRNNINSILESISIIPINDSAVKFIQYIYMYLLVIPLSILAFQIVQGKRNNYRILDNYRKPQKSFGWVFRWIVISMGIVYITGIVTKLCSFAFQYISGITLYDSSPGAELFVMFSVEDTLVMTLPAMVFAPVFEELLFRGVVCRNNEPTGQLFAIVASGLLFGLWHANYIQAVYATVMGMLCCFLYLKTKSLIPSMIFHFLINTISVVNMLVIGCIDIDALQSEDIYQIIPYIGQILFLLCSVLLIFCIIISSIILLILEIVLFRKSFKFEKTKLSISLIRKNIVYYTSPITLIVMSFLVFATVMNAVFGYWEWLKI